MNAQPQPARWTNCPCALCATMIPRFLSAETSSTHARLCFITSERSEWNCIGSSHVLLTFCFYRHGIDEADIVPGDTFICEKQTEMGRHYQLIAPGLQLAYTPYIKSGAFGVYDALTLPEGYSRGLGHLFLGHDLLLGLGYSSMLWGDSDSEDGDSDDEDGMIWDADNIPAFGHGMDYNEYNDSYLDDYYDEDFAF